MAELSGGACPTNACAQATNLSLALCPTIRFGYPRSADAENEIIGVVTEVSLDTIYPTISQTLMVACHSNIAGNVGGAACASVGGVRVIII
jgi:hypothetical protein